MPNTLTFNCLNNRGQVNPLKTSTITELTAASNGDRRFEVTTLEFVTERAKELGRGRNYTHTYRFDGSVFMSEISDGTVRVKSVQDCQENGLSQHPLFDAGFQQKVYDADTKAFLDDYRRKQAGRKHTQEEIGEMVAAFGPGETVVNVITGKRTKLPGRRRSKV